MPLIDPKSGALLPDPSLYGLDPEADFWPVHQYWLGCRDPRRFPGAKALPNNMFVEEMTPDWAFSKQMYWDVGGPWIWGDKRAYSDDYWRDYAAQSGFRQFRLNFKNGDLAGFAETSMTAESRLGTLEYFGLLPVAVGKGVGSAFLSQIIEKMWADNPSSLRISTCTLDHPGAFRVYSRAGFERISSHSTSEPNAIKKRIISSQEFQMRAKLLG